jgi:uncharacterized protein involved in response to NO
MNKGHAPFFLAAAGFAIVAIGWWAAILAGAAPPPSGWSAPRWHAHEMLFGYTSAVLAGFLLIGTGPRRVAVLLGLWLAGRVAVALAGALPPALVAALDLAFLPALALLREPPVWRGFRWPTVGFVPLLGALAGADLLCHLEPLGLLPGGAGRGIILALDLFGLMIAVMAGRLVPGYTRAMAIPVRKPRDPVAERVSIALLVVVLVADQLGSPIPAGAAALAAGALQAWRLAGWRTGDVLRRPLLLVLHVGFAWFAAGLALRGVAALAGALSPTDALHAETIGAIGLLTLGMMTRLARTHGRRPLAAGAATVASSALLAGAALVRVALPVLAPAPALAVAGWLGAGALWIAAFALFLVSHAAMLPGAGRGRPPA